MNSTDSDCPEPLIQHLSMIETLWSVVRSGSPDRPDASAAQRQLLNRYGPSVRLYLKACLRDPDAVDEVYQEFALRLVRGDFRTADPKRGRFRYYVKSVVYRLMIDHYRSHKRQQRHVSLQQDPVASVSGADDETDVAFNHSWRQGTLDQAWDSLAHVESDGGPPYHTAMIVRVENPDWSSDELARELSQRLGRPLNSGAARVMLHRARERFADALIMSIAQSLQQASFDSIEEELLELNLMSYCRSALQRYRQSASEAPAESSSCASSKSSSEMSSED